MLAYCVEFKSRMGLLTLLGFMVGHKSAILLLCYLVESSDNFTITTEHGHF